MTLAEREQWVPGNVRWGVRHEGRTYLFAGPEEQRRFLDNRNYERYAPALSGNDVVLFAEQGLIVPGRRDFGGWYQNRLYLFSSEETCRKFDADPARYLGALDKAASAMAAPRRQY